MAKHLAPIGSKSDLRRLNTLAPKHLHAGRCPNIVDVAATSDAVGRSAAMMSLLVIVSRITGFVRTWAQAFALGTTLLASCYTVANNLPNQLYELVAGGMLVTAFLPVYLECKQRAGQEGANRYISNLLSIILLCMAIVTIICIIFAAPLIWVQSAMTDQSQMSDAVILFRFFAVEVLLYCLSTIASGVLNAERDFFWSNAAPIFNNLITILSFVIYVVLIDIQPVIAFLILAIGNPLGVFVQLLVQLPSLRRHGVQLSLHIDLRDSALRETLAIGVPSLVVTLCSFVTVSVMNTMALVAAPEQGSSIQYYARLWYTLPYSVFTVPITTALFTELSSLFGQGDLNGFAKIIIMGLRQIMFVLVPCMLYLMVFSVPLMTLMQMGQFDSESTHLTASYLSSLALALPFYGLAAFFQKIFSSMRRMAVFALANIVASVAQVTFTITLTAVLGIHAVSLGSALYSISVDFISLTLLRHLVKGFDLRRVFFSFMRSLALGCMGALVGGGILWLLTGQLGPCQSPMISLIYILVGGIPSFVVTFGLGIVLHVPEASLFSRLFSRLIERVQRFRDAHK